jgi:hypothetical protein
MDGWMDAYGLKEGTKKVKTHTPSQIKIKNINNQ